MKRIARRHADNILDKRTSPSKSDDIFESSAIENSIQTAFAAQNPSIRSETQVQKLMQPSSIETKTAQLEATQKSGDTAPRLGSGEADREADVVEAQAMSESLITVHDGEPNYTTLKEINTAESQILSATHHLLQAIHNGKQRRIRHVQRGYWRLYSAEFYHLWREAHPAQRWDHPEALIRCTEDGQKSY
jgi:hypothetical protein